MDFVFCSCRSSSYTETTDKCMAVILPLLSRLKMIGTIFLAGFYVLWSLFWTILMAGPSLLASSIGSSFKFKIFIFSSYFLVNSLRLPVFYISSLWQIYDMLSYWQIPLIPDLNTWCNIPSFKGYILYKYKPKLRLMLNYEVSSSDNSRTVIQWGWQRCICTNIVHRSR